MNPKTVERQLATRFLKAKIRTDPHGYKVSDRILMISTRRMSEGYSAFRRPLSTEFQLQEILGLDAGIADGWLPGMGLNSDDVGANNAPGVVPDPYVHEFLFTRFNNIVVDLYVLEKLCSTYGAVAATFLSGTKFDAFMELMLLMTSSESLTPYLPSAIENSNAGLSLCDVMDMKVEREDIAKSYVPAFADSDLPGAGNDYVMLTFNWAKDDWPNVAPKSSVRREISAKLAYFYAMESIYMLSKSCFSEAERADFVSIFPNIKLFGFPTLAKWDALGTLSVEPDFQACLLDDMSARFDAFKAYFKKHFAAAAWEPVLDSDAAMLYFKSCHNYAMLEYRKRYIQLMYVEAKKQGKMTKDAMTRVLECSGLDPSNLGAPATDDSVPPLLDLGLDAYTDDVTSSGDPKDVVRTKSTGAPTLDALSILKSDLDSSPYDYNVQDVVHKSTYAASYNSVSSKLNLLTNELIKSVREIKTYNFGGKNPGKSSGKLDMKNLYRYRTDPHIFYDTTYKVKEMDLAFGIILDESGSMRGTGIQNGRVAMIMLHEVCLALGIDHSVIGHTSRGHHNCIVHRYWNFDEDPKHTLAVPYGLANIDAHNGNCDSGALFYMQTQLKTVPHKDKIVLIFSDGEPTECTDMELKQQIRDMEASGIHVIGIGIDFDSIKEYYGDYANGRNMTDMVRIITEILQRYVLEKGD
ncbi:hypothetical protein [Paratractidigestivibacter sp.]|uniref:hypothetical protein n=1 Tax=Paratractidigestivibacter sp. TaxID=2847316 RepID=UPI002AC897D0|nr:hypothetical protein [Paratractidigestivibacter sp.]